MHDMIHLCMYCILAWIHICVRLSRLERADCHIPKHTCTLAYIHTYIHTYSKSYTCLHFDTLQTGASWVSDIRAERTAQECERGVHVQCSPCYSYSNCFKVQVCILTCTHRYIHAHIYEYIHAYMHNTYIHTYIQCKEAIMKRVCKSSKNEGLHLHYSYTYIHTYMQSCSLARKKPMHTYILTYMHAVLQERSRCVHTYLHAYMQTYIHTYSLAREKHVSESYEHVKKQLKTALHTYMHTYIHTYSLAREKRVSESYEHVKDSA